MRPMRPMRPLLRPRRRPTRRLAGTTMSAILLTLVAGGSLAGCAGHDDAASTSASDSASSSPAASVAAPASGSPAASVAAPASGSPAASIAAPASDSPVGVPNGEGMGDSTTLPAPEEIAAAWAIRPAFVSHSGHDTEAAYAFVVARPDILEWMPCYCGCAALDHRSNLECFLERRQARAPIVFEEHASYCEICVKTALTAKQMLGQGATLLQMRSAVDAAYGGLGVPGTPTELPPG